MKQTFEQKSQQVWEEAQLFIENSINEGETIRLLKEEDEEDIDNLFNLPFVYQVGKYSQYDEYAILSVRKEDGQIILHTKCKGEDSTISDFILPEMEHTNLCMLADEIDNIKNTI